MKKIFTCIKDFFLKKEEREECKCTNSVLKMILEFIQNYISKLVKIQTFFMNVIDKFIH